MKILIVNTYFSKGGAARAALRLYKALKGYGTDVEYISIYPESMSLISKIRYLFRVAIDRLPGAIAARKKVMFSSGAPSNKKLIIKINESDVDVVHLHWVNGGGVSVSDLSRINKPVIWSLHDMWAFTGGCHYDGNCNRYIDGCGSCPVIESVNNKDASADQLKKKTSVFNDIDLTAVGLSRWITDCASSSKAMKSARVVNLPNPIDSKIFYPAGKTCLKDGVKFPKDKKLILFGAMSAIDDPRKGYQELTSALRLIPAKQDIELMIFGSDSPKKPPELGFKANYLGHVSRDEDLRELYSVADVMVVPSLQENLSNAIMESLACGTPVVCFDIGGNRDMVDHKVNGYLATPYDPYSLAEGISWVMCSHEHDTLSKNAREKVLKYFDSRIVAEQYKELYKECLERNDGINRGGC